LEAITELFMICHQKYLSFSAVFWTTYEMLQVRHYDEGQWAALKPVSFFIEFR
jgi:hypothetical protein